jgi:hypothetical protein
VPCRPRLVAGKLNKQIAAEFGTGVVTVKEQRAKVMLKMQAASFAELVRFALRLEITNLEITDGSTARVAGNPGPRPESRATMALPMNVFTACTRRPPAADNACRRPRLLIPGTRRSRTKQTASSSRPD